MTRGFTVLELTVALLLMGVTLSALLPAARRQGDRIAVIAAREATVSMLARARREARASGGATLRMRRTGGQLWLEANGAPHDTLHLETRFGVALGLPTEEARLAFDALGIGRLANRTVSFARGEARAGVTVSAYGRVRRW